MEADLLRIQGLHLYASRMPQMPAKFNIPKLSQSPREMKPALLELLYDKDVQRAISRHSEWDGETLSANINAFFLIAMAIQVHAMQVGYALYEAGFVRSKNASNSFWKNCICGYLSSVGFWLFGYAIAFGPSADGVGIIGSDFWAFYNLPTADYALWFYHSTFCATTCIIISGAIAERAHLIFFVTSCIVTSSFTYPIVVHWVWSDCGWLKRGVAFYDGHNSTSNCFANSFANDVNESYDDDIAKSIDGKRISFEDFAGSGPVHVVGGAASLAAIFMLGPRRGRWFLGSVARSALSLNEADRDLPGHSMTLTAIGWMIITTGYIAFNASSHMQLGTKGDDAIIGRTAANTLLGGAGGAIASSIISYILTRKWLLLPMFSGGLAGNVAVCAGCNVFEGWAAFVVGCLGGMAYLGVSYLVENKLKLDDVVDAVGVHLGAGLVGLIALALFQTEYGVFYNWNARSFIFLGWQIVGALTIASWSAINTLIVFFLVNVFQPLRYRGRIERRGMDYAHGHEVCYPTKANAWMPASNNDGSREGRRDALRPSQFEISMTTLDDLILKSEQHNVEDVTAVAQTMPSPKPSNASSPSPMIVSTELLSVNDDTQVQKDSPSGKKLSNADSENDKIANLETLEITFTSPAKLPRSMSSYRNYMRQHYQHKNRFRSASFHHNHDTTQQSHHHFHSNNRFARSSSPIAPVDIDRLAEVTEI